MILSYFKNIFEINHETQKTEIFHLYLNFRYYILTIKILCKD